MIQSKELRIGNVVLDKDNNIFTIAGISEGSVFKEGDYIGTPIEWIKPVLITEEWLLKLGFEKEKYSSLSINFFRLKVLSHGTISFYPKEKGFNIELGTTSGYNFGTTKIEYVHQLQNLYFALTNEELTFKV